MEQQLNRTNLDPYFSLGLVFPDVRYELEIERTITHPELSSEDRLLDYLLHNISEDYLVHEQKIQAGMYCHVYHDYWWRDHTMPETNDEIARSAVHIADDIICFEVLDRSYYVKALQSVRKSSVPYLDSSQTPAFVDRVITYLSQDQYDPSQIMHYWIKKKGWSQMEVDAVIATARELLQETQFTEKIRHLKASSWDSKIIDRLSEFI